MRDFHTSLVISALLLGACTNNGLYSGSDPTTATPNIIEDLLATNVYTVRTIQSHYQHGDANSETTLIVYEQGDSGFTKQILCMFPPDFLLDGGLTTLKINEMKIPPQSRHVFDLYKGECNRNHSCVYTIMEKENPKLNEYSTFVAQRLLDPSNTDSSALIYSGSGPSTQKKLMDRWTLEWIYNEGKSLDYDYRGELQAVPELTGIKKVRVLGLEEEFSETTKYKCEKVE